MQRVTIAFFLFFWHPCVSAKTGLFFNVALSEQNLQISTVVPNKTYPAAGIKINTPTYSLVNVGNDCVLEKNGYCLFSVNNTTPKTLTITGPDSGSLTLTLCLNGQMRLSCQNYTVTTGPLRAKTIIVGDNNTNHILSFPATGNGNVTPLTDLSGNNTGINLPYGLYLDPSSDQLWVSNFNSNTISQFNFPATGNITPLITIEGGSTMLSGPVGAGKDTSGNLYVANYLANTISIFPSGSQGDQSPSGQIISTNGSLATPSYLWITDAGNLFVANQGTNPFTPSVVEFAPGANGSATPIKNISGNTTTLVQPAGLWIDISGNIWVSDNYTADIVEFASDADGDVAPIRTLNNPQIFQPYGLAVDHAGYIYVACCNGGSGYILVFEPTATGTAEPIQQISGSNTGLSCPQGLTIEQ